jgi:uncharacterized protein involved in outer membrane biogenesis
VQFEFLKEKGGMFCNRALLNSTHFASGLFPCSDPQKEIQRINSEPARHLNRANNARYIRPYTEKGFKTKMMREQNARAYKPEEGRNVRVSFTGLAKYSILAPMKFIRRNIYLILALALLGILAGGGTFILNKLFHLDSYKDEILSELQQSLNRRVTYEKGTFSFRFGAAFTFTKVVIMERADRTPFLTADKLTFGIALLPLLEKRIVIKDIMLDKPRISLSRDSSGKFNISDLLEGRNEELPLHIKGIRIKKGQIDFLDLAAAPEGVKTSLEETDLSISRLVRGKSCSFKFSSNLAGEGKRGSIALSGTAILADKDKPLSDTLVKASMTVKNLDSGHYWPYYQAYVPFRKIVGMLDLDTDFKGRLREFSAKGSARINGLRFDYPTVFHAVLAPRDVRFDYDMELTPRNISVKSLDLNVDGLKVKGDWSLLDIPSGDPRITAHARTSTFRLEDFHQYIPYGIIPDDTSHYIEQHIKGGTYKLDAGTLDGRVSQIVHMERGENYNVLAIRGTVEKGLLAYGPEVPTFNNIKGELEMKGKDFLLHRMTANFGGSPFSLEGKIADYPLDTPCRYLFDMSMTPRQAEIAWLLGKESGKKMIFTGDTKLHLSGNGTTGGYNLSCDWDLTTASYSYPDTISKPAGWRNQLTFKGTIDQQQAHLTTLQFNFSPLALAMSGVYRYSGENGLTLELKSNQFSINDVAPLIPLVRKYQPAGHVQAAVHGESRTGKREDLHWGGQVTFTGFSFKPSERLKPVSNMSGTINFKGTSLESSHLAARLGSSTIYFKGSMTGFKAPTFTLAFSAPSLDMADLGLHAPGTAVRATAVQGNISLADNNLHIKALSGKIGDSEATIKGTVQDISNPKIDITVTSPYLELNDLLHLAELERTGKKEGGGGATLKATLHADAGKVKAIDFEKLAATVMLENRILYLQPLETSALGGHVSGKVRVDLGSGGLPPRYQVSYSMEKVSADLFAQAFGIQHQEITGTMSMQGDLTAKGNNSAELKQTVLGSVKFRSEHGSLRKFPVLSKIFSILNVSQLLKFHLPDMVKDGMPYNSISATVGVQDGIASSQDFYIASNAMNISAVGKVDLVKDEVDATIGVQPLQSVEKVVNRIPVVGWILTGGKKTFLTTYFEAKGKLEDPSVKAIPVKSMAKGVLNIFKRVFELPGKLITDTGEVLIGN